MNPSTPQSQPENEIEGTWYQGGGCLVLAAPAPLFVGLIGLFVVLGSDSPDEDSMTGFLITLFATAAVCVGLYFLLGLKRLWSWLLTVVIALAAVAVLVVHGLDEAGRLAFLPATAIAAATAMLLRPEVVRYYLSKR